MGRLAHESNRAMAAAEDQTSHRTKWWPRTPCGWSKGLAGATNLSIRMKICQAVTPEDIALTRALFEEYAAWLGMDLCFQGFAGELAGLPGLYPRRADACSWLWRVAKPQAASPCGLGRMGFAR